MVGAGHQGRPGGLTPAQRVILQRNLIGAMRTYMTEVSLLETIEIVGPSTTRDLCVYARALMPHVTRTTLQRRLTQLRRVRVVQVFPLGARRMLWALPSQGKPKPRRPPAPRAPNVSPQPATASLGSWWIGKDRATFYDTMKARWPA